MARKVLGIQLSVSVSISLKMFSEVTVTTRLGCLGNILRKDEH